jgi:hypothetical protein
MGGKRSYGKVRDAALKRQRWSAAGPIAVDTTAPADDGTALACCGEVATPDSLC